MNDKSVIDRFYDNVMIFSEFIESLIKELNKKGHTSISPGILGIAIDMLRDYDRTRLIQGFIRKSHTHWPDIKKKDESFISENVMVIFSAIPSNYVNSINEAFKKRDKDGRLVVSDEQRNTIWDFLHPFIKISIKYIHEHQGPYLDQTGRRRYTQRYADDQGIISLDIPTLARDWGVAIKF